MNRSQLLEAYDKLFIESNPNRENRECENCSECEYCDLCENCNSCKECTACLRCNDCIMCISCIDCILCTNCESCCTLLMCSGCKNCTNCILCRNIRDKENGYWLLNKEVTKEEFEEARDDKIGPEYHISITKNGNQRCSSNEAKFVLKHFDMEHSDEDNRTMIARHFWVPVADNKAENYYSWPRRLINEKRHSICINSSHIINQIAKEEN